MAYLTLLIELRILRILATFGAHISPLQAYYWDIQFMQSAGIVHHFKILKNLRNVSNLGHIPTPYGLLYEVHHHIKQSLFQM